MHTRRSAVREAALVVSKLPAKMPAPRCWSLPKSRDGLLDSDDTPSDRTFVRVRLESRSATDHD